MSLLFAFLAAGAASAADAPLVRPVIPAVVYTAVNTPTKALKLDPKQVCLDVDGEPVQYVDAGRLAFQIIVQFEQYDDLKATTVTERLKELNGDACAKPDPQAPALTKTQKARVAAYCDGSIAIQRMLMGIYPGFKTTTATAAGFAKINDVRIDGAPLTAAEVEAALKEDIEDLVAPEGGPAVGPQSERQRRIVVALTQAFLASTPNEKYVACTFGEPETKVAKEEPAVVDRYQLASTLASGATGFGAIVSKFQFRSRPGNLIYRGDISDLSSAPATWAAGRDIDSTDSGFSISLNRSIGDEAEKDLPNKPDGYRRTKSFKIQGAIGLPLCGLINPEGKPCKFPGKKIDFDVTPYLARDYERESKRVL